MFSKSLLQVAIDTVHKLKSLIKCYPLVFVKESWFIPLSRFSLELSKYEAEIHHVPGVENEVSDVLSRNHKNIDDIVKESKEKNDLPP